jgi:hypothetical protein
VNTPMLPAIWLNSQPHCLAMSVCVLQLTTCSTAPPWTCPSTTLTRSLSHHGRQQCHVKAHCPRQVLLMHQPSPQAASLTCPPLWLHASHRVAERLTAKLPSVGRKSTGTRLTATQQCQQDKECSTQTDPRSEVPCKSSHNRTQTPRAALHACVESTAPLCRWHPAHHSVEETVMAVSSGPARDMHRHQCMPCCGVK